MRPPPPEVLPLFHNLLLARLRRSPTHETTEFQHCRDRGVQSVARAMAAPTATSLIFLDSVWGRQAIIFFRDVSAKEKLWSEEEEPVSHCSETAELRRVIYLADILLPQARDKERVATDSTG